MQFGLGLLALYFPAVAKTCWRCDAAFHRLSVISPSFQHKSAPPAFSHPTPRAPLASPRKAGAFPPRPGAFPRRRPGRRVRRWPPPAAPNGRRFARHSAATLSPLPIRRAKFCFPPPNGRFSSTIFKFNDFSLQIHPIHRFTSFSKKGTAFHSILKISAASWQENAIYKELDASLAEKGLNG